jgi:DNA mismatch repair protein MutS2
VLIDELGSGTDPDEGAALSQAILEVLVERAAVGLVTTHLAPLKVFASRTEGVRNAAMRFDVEALSPTFELTSGSPVARTRWRSLAASAWTSGCSSGRRCCWDPKARGSSACSRRSSGSARRCSVELDEARASGERARDEAALLREQIERLREREAELLSEAAEKADAMLHDTLQRATQLRRTARESPEQRGKALEAIQALRRETRQQAVRGYGRRRQRSGPIGAGPTSRPPVPAADPVRPGRGCGSRRTAPRARSSRCAATPWWCSSAC